MKECEKKWIPLLLWFFYFLSFSPLKAVGFFLQEENDAIPLLAFKSYLSPSSKGLLTSWNKTNLDPCNGWRSITCNSDGRVVEIRLVNLGIRGRLNPESPGLGRLSKLERLILPGNKFFGYMPASLASISNLKEINIANNSITGKIPRRIFDLQRLSILNLQNNRLTGTLDPQIGNLQSLHKLDVSENAYTGNLPQTFSNLRSLLDLDLSGNQFQGSINVLMNLTNLTGFNVSRNNFSGVVPTKGLFSRFPASAFAENPFLCHTSCNTSATSRNLIHSAPIYYIIAPSPPPSPPPPPPPPPSPPRTLPQNSPSPTSNEPSPPKASPPSNPPKSFPAPQISPNSSPAISPQPSILSPSLSPINSSSLPSTSVTPSPSILNANSSKSSNEDKQTNLSAGVIFGIAIGAFGAFVLIILCLTVFCPCISHRKTSPEIPSDVVYMFYQKPLRVEDLMQATDNLGRTTMVMDGSVGYTHKATFVDGTYMTVKRIPRDVDRSERDFSKLMKRLSKLRNPNVVPLLGYWTHENENVLLYEYFPKGTLHDLLHSEKRSRRAEKWSIRYKIALDVAKGLVYLHSANPPLVHRDLHLKNILLSKDYDASIADAGLARYVTNTSDIYISPDSLGYVAPEYSSIFSLHLKPTVKGDVYSYGIILLEILTGKKPIDKFADSSQVSIIDWINEMLAQRKAQAILDPRVDRWVCEDEMLQLLKIALLCASFDADTRPQMDEVVMMLLRARETAAQIKQVPQARELLL